MKPITEYSVEEAAQMRATYSELIEKVKGTTRNDWFEDFEKLSGYGHYKFSGRVSDKLINLIGREPTPTDIILLVDSGFSHFGATCSLSNRSFRGLVNTD